MAPKKIKPSDIRRWKPVRRVENAEREFLGDLDRFLESNFPSLRFIWSRIPGEDRPWIPMGEVYETDDAFVARVELPGVNLDDVDVSVSGDTLIVKGERKPPEDVPAEQYHQCETCYGKFYKRVGLPSDVDVDKIEASFENGILEVDIAKSKAAKATKIKIKKT